jgi:hypothetical protein
MICIAFFLGLFFKSARRTESIKEMGWGKGEMIERPTTRDGGRKENRSVSGVCLLLVSGLFLLQY